MRQLVAGNWKMNGRRADGLALAEALTRRMEAAPPGCDLLVCPPATLLMAVGEALAGTGIAWGGQDCHPEPKGAHTGDISAPMLADLGCSHVILGHSERRADHCESDGEVRAKAAAALAAGLIPVICVGESLIDRDAGDALTVCERQLRGSVPGEATADRLVIAYEPVWAIGTGRTPSDDQIAVIHAQIRTVLTDLVGEGAAVPILYGGSVKPRNAQAILAIANVDGALVGGASLEAADFWAIAEAATG